ncbi:reverse transcriptase domain-containing protein [Tanacetum coccineum]
MSAMVNTTPIVTTVTKTATKEKTPKETGATPRVNILDFYEEHYEEIFPVIMDKVCRDKQREVHARLDFGENSKKSQRMREGSQNSSARTLPARYHNLSKRPKERDRLRSNDENVFGRLGHRRQSAFEGLSGTYSPSTTKSAPDLENSRDHSRSRGRSHGWDSSLSRDRPQSRDHSYGIEKSHGNTCSSYMTGALHRSHSRDSDRSHGTKRGRGNESTLSHVSKSDTSKGGHWKSKSKRCKPTEEEDLAVPWTCEEVDPFTPRISNFKIAAQVERWAMHTWCHMFNSTLIGTARVWFDELPLESIDGYKALKAVFLAYFMQQKKYIKDPVEIHNIKQRDGETIKDFIERFKVETGRMRGAPECMRISGFVHEVNNPELTKRLNEQVPKTMEEMMLLPLLSYEEKMLLLPKRKVTPCGNQTDPTSMVQSGNQTSEVSQGKDEGLTVPAGKLAHLIKEIKQNKEQPKAGKKDAPAKDKSMAIYMIQPWHRVTRQKVTQSFARISEITFPPLATSGGAECPLVIEAEIGGNMIHRMYVDGGSLTEVIYEHCFNQLRPEIKSQMVPATTSLTGFSGETIWPLGQLRLLVTIGDADHSIKAWMNFMIVRSLSHTIVLLEGPEYEKSKSTILISSECATVTTSSKETPKEDEVCQENFKVALHPNFPDEEVTIEGTLSVKERTELCSLLKRNLDLFTWQPSNMTGVPRSVAEHQLIIQEGYSTVRQKKRVMVKKHDEIDWKVESLCRYPFKCFLDAYKGYHQIHMAKSDEEKTAFHTSQGVYCYTKMPFGLKNTGAIYQRLVDKAFDNQVGRNIEVYVDDLVINSHTEAEMLRDIDETFCMLRKINIKLNPKKCTFGAVEGMFLGYMISPKGIKLYHDKTEAVLQLPSLLTIKKVQSLNGKLASLNRFLSKSAEKYLPLFKTLKKCIKKSDFHWTPEAEQAFKQLKQHLSELPLLIAPKPKEELIVYLSASHGAISAVLMTERGTVQMLVYFVSRTLQGPELNYTPMEKLVLSLVFAAKRLRRYFQAHPITVIIDQPIKQIMSRPDMAGRLQKWSVMLGEHSITYRPRTSVKGQILADFLIEKPDENGSGAGLILTSPEGMKITYALRFPFTTSNNEAKYEALIAGLRIVTQMGVHNVHVFVEILKKKSIQEEKVATVVEEEGPTWMTPIMEHLKNGTLPDDRKEASKLRIKARQYELLEEDNIVCHFGLPGEIVSDNGIQFNDNPFKDWCEKLNITQRFTLVKHPQSNGLVERANRSLGEGIKARLGKGNKNYMEELPYVLWAHRTMIKSSHGDTPFSLTYGTEAVIPAEIRMPTYRTTVVDVIHNNEELWLNLDLLEERRECAAILEAKAKLKMIKYYNVRVRGVTFRPGDFVYRSNDASHAADGGKLGQK